MITITFDKVRAKNMLSKRTHQAHVICSGLSVLASQSYQLTKAVTIATYQELNK